MTVLRLLVQKTQRVEQTDIAAMEVVLNAPLRKFQRLFLMDAKHQSSVMPELRLVVQEQNRAELHILVRPASVIKFLYTVLVQQDIA